MIDRERRRWSLVAPAAATILVLLAGCGGDGDTAPSSLLDGSSPPPVPTALDGVDDAVMTTMRFVEPSSGRASACGARVHADPRPPLVERIGVQGRSLTFASHARVFACEAAAEAGEGPASACGGAEGRREAGTLADPRLDLANCTDADGNAVAFIWVEPKARPAFVAVEHDGWSEVYRVGDDRLPVRVATTDGIDAGRSALSVTVAQYAEDGSKLGEEELLAHVAG